MDVAGRLRTGHDTCVQLWVQRAIHAGQPNADAQPDAHRLPHRHADPGLFAGPDRNIESATDESADRGDYADATPGVPATGRLDVLVADMDTDSGSDPTPDAGLCEIGRREEALHLAGNADAGTGG